MTAVAARAYRLVHRGGFGKTQPSLGGRRHEAAPLWPPLGPEQKPQRRTQPLGPSWPVTGLHAQDVRRGKKQVRPAFSSKQSRKTQKSWSAEASKKWRPPPGNKRTPGSVFNGTLPFVFGERALQTPWSSCGSWPKERSPRMDALP